MGVVIIWEGLTGIPSAMGSTGLWNGSVSGSVYQTALNTGPTSSSNENVWYGERNMNFKTVLLTSI